MPETLHDGDFAAGNAVGDRQRFLGRAGIVVFAGQQIRRTFARIDLGDAGPDVAVELVEIQIAFENAGAALHVMPQRFPALVVGRVGAHQSGNDGCGDFPAMDVGTVQEIQVVIGIDMGAGLQADDRAEAIGVLERDASSALTRSFSASIIPTLPRALQYPAPLICPIADIICVIAA